VHLFCKHDKFENVAVPLYYYAICCKVIWNTKQIDRNHVVLIVTKKANFVGNIVTSVGMWCIKTLKFLCKQCRFHDMKGNCF